MYWIDIAAFFLVIIVLAIVMTWAGKNKSPRVGRPMTKEELRKETEFHHKAGGGTFLDPD